MGGDREANYLEALIAVFVAVEEFQKHGLNITSILAAALCSGTALSSTRVALEPDGRDEWAPRPRMQPDDLPRLIPACAEWLVKQSHDRTKRPLAFRRCVQPRII